MIPSWVVLVERRHRTMYFWVVLIFQRHTKVRVEFEWLDVYKYTLSWLDELRSGGAWAPKDGVSV